VSRVIPYELARLRGFPGKRKQRGPQPIRTEAVPEPLPFLGETAQAEWRRLAP
jgi:hypothetical protein